MANKIQIRRDVAANWTSSNPTLSQGEQGYETDTGKIKIGDGSTAWTSLGYSFEGSTVGGATGTDYDDDVKVRFGTGNDLEIYHDGTTNNSYIKETNASGHLIIQGQEIQFDNAAGTSLMNLSGSQIELLHGGSTKLETTSSGIQTTGTVNVNGAYTLPTSDGTNGQVLTTDGSGAVTFADAGGGGAALELYAENPSSPTAPSATGTNAVAIGSGSSATGTKAISIGDTGSIAAQEAVGIGDAAIVYSSATQGVAVGKDTQVGGAYSAALGTKANVSSGQYATAIGCNSAAAGATVAGNGAIAIGASYASGTDSFAAAIDLNSSSYGALSSNSVAIGKYAKSNSSNGVAIGNGSLASGLSAVTLGISSLASGTFSTAIGYGSYASAGNSVSVGRSSNASGSQSLALGYQSSASGTHSAAIGRNAKAELYGKLAYTAHDFGASSIYSQAGTYVLMSDTTDATAEALTTNNSTAGATNQIILPNNGAYSFSGTIIAREDATDGSDYASWEIKGALLRDANAASTVLGNGIKNKLYASAGASAWDIALTADTTNGGLKIEVTGAASTNIRWVATVNTSEVTYA